MRTYSIAGGIPHCRCITHDVPWLAPHCFALIEGDTGRVFYPVRGSCSMCACESECLFQMVCPKCWKKRFILNMMHTIVLCTYTADRGLQFWLIPQAKWGTGSGLTFPADEHSFDSAYDNLLPPSPVRRLMSRTPSFTFSMYQYHEGGYASRNDCVVYIISEDCRFSATNGMGVWMPRPTVLTEHLNQRVDAPWEHRVPDDTACDVMTSVYAMLARGVQPPSQPVTMEDDFASDGTPHSSPSSDDKPSHSEGLG